MLIVGDAAMPGIDIKDIEYTEIIVDGSKVDKLKEVLKLEGAAPLSISLFSKLYYRKADNRRFILHNVGNNFQLRRLVDAHSALDQVKVATPAMNYVFMWTLQSIRFKSPFMWAKKVDQIKTLRPYFESTFQNQADNTKHRHIGKYISYYLKKINIFSDVNFKYSNFEYFNKYALLNLVSSEVSLNRSYRRFTLEHIDHYYIQNIFEVTLNDKQKFHAIMDKIYIDTINEYFIPELIIDGKFPIRQKWKELFVTSIMNTYLVENEADQDFDFIREYIYNNLNKLIENYEHGAFETFILAYQKKSLKINKKI